MIRETYSKFSSAEKTQLKDDLEKRSRTAPIFQRLHWRQTLEALMIIEDSSNLIKQVNKFLAEKTNVTIADDFDNYGAFVNRSLLNSIANADLPTRTKILSKLSKKIDEHEAWFAKQIFEDDYDRIYAKDKKRVFQSLQRILVQKEFNELLQTIAQAKRTLRPDVIEKLENYLTLLRSPNSDKYSIKVVIDVAKAFQDRAKSLFGPRDHLVIFGSFPNLNAKRSSSDIDMFLSDRLDSIYAYQIEGLETSTGKLNSPENLTDTEGQKLLTTLIEMDQIANSVFGSQVKHGELIAVTTRSRSFWRGQWTIDTSFAEMTRNLTKISPVTILITANQIVLRIHDTMGSAPRAPDKIYEIPILGEISTNWQKKSSD